MKHSSASLHGLEARTKWNGHLPHAALEMDKLEAGTHVLSLQTEANDGLVVPHVSVAIRSTAVLHYKREVGHTGLVVVRFEMDKLEGSTHVLHYEQRLSMRS